MKKEVKNKLKEIGNYGLCIAIVLGIAYYTGILKGFAPSDFENAYKQITTDLSQSPTIKNNNINLGNTTSKGSTRSTSYNNYQVTDLESPLDIFPLYKKPSYFRHSPDDDCRCFKPHHRFLL